MEAVAHRTLPVNAPLPASKTSAATSIGSPTMTLPRPGSGGIFLMIAHPEKIGGSLRNFM
jgi:hypothetical protein